MTDMMDLAMATAVAIGFWFATRPFQRAAAEKKIKHQHRVNAEQRRNI